MPPKSDIPANRGNNPPITQSGQVVARLDHKFWISEMSSGMRQLVERFYGEVWNGRLEAVAHDILVPDFSFRGSLGVERKGVEAFLGYARSVHEALQDYRCTINEIVVEGERAAARMNFSGIHTGEFYDVAGTGREISWTGAAFFVSRSQRLSALWVIGDIDAIKAQIGADVFTRFK